jgi:hypothetical protein
VDPGVETAPLSVPVEELQLHPVTVRRKGFRGACREAQWRSVLATVILGDDDNLRPDVGKAVKFIGNGFALLVFHSQLDS